ncbi:helix-turn-helix domain-containing protein [Sulfurovum sp. NBC37-1]|uniref:helix-turn-helix domain-containing protein n=1 Tax=Sulfurovum sp. (strain NBC37-1) TaxID=387093 RepID=UPI0001587CD2|nr:helix-turn-helix domain-containing protein [Sulfurovum sp. NBC37-1]BAF72586.1 transcriptional regulator, Fis family [Sulfurovum sp. NBC37-1]
MEQFFTKSDQIQNIIKGFNLTKTLFVSSIIIGEANTGKKTLARYLFPDAPMVSGKEQKVVEAALEEHDELIITDFEKLGNQETLKFDNKRIIATANFVGNYNTIDALFAFIYMLPSLKERSEDARYIRDIFIDKAKNDLMIEELPADITEIPMDLSHNSKSLKKAVYRYLTIRTMDKQSIKDAVYYYMLEQMEGNNTYKEYLELYEKPLIEAGLKKYGSQLQLSQVLGINRNTLRKKIHEHDID